MSTPIDPKSPEEILEMINMVMSKNRFSDPMVAAIGDVWLTEVEALKHFWNFKPCDQSLDDIIKECLTTPTPKPSGSSSGSKS